MHDRSLHDRKVSGCFIRQLFQGGFSHLLIGLVFQLLRLFTGCEIADCAKKQHNSSGCRITDGFRDRRVIQGLICELNHADISFDSAFCVEH